MAFNARQFAAHLSQMGTGAEKCKAVEGALEKMRSPKTADIEKALEGVVPQGTVAKAVDLLKNGLRIVPEVEDFDASHLVTKEELKAFRDSLDETINNMLGHIGRLSDQVAQLEMMLVDTETVDKTPETENKNSPDKVK